MNPSRASTLNSDLQNLIREQSAVLPNKIKGQLAWLERVTSGPETTGIQWALRAQLGTLTKFQQLYVSERPFGGTELVALARNLFENLVWLKLFNATPDYGVLFYKRLLLEQLESQKQAIAKGQQEIELFESLATQENSEMAALWKRVPPNASDAQLEQTARAMKEIEASMDRKSRQAFSIYAQAATSNGYQYQVQIIKEKAIPIHEKRIATLNRHLSELECQLPLSVQQVFLPQLSTRWNWSVRAEQVGLKSHYSFLYAYTSRLLHCSPMSLITPVSLDQREYDLFLDYLFIGASNAFDTIVAFDYPGKVDMLYVDIDDENQESEAH